MAIVWEDIGRNSEKLDLRKAAQGWLHNIDMTEQSKAKVTRLDYCQYLLSSQINYTLRRAAGAPEALLGRAPGETVPSDALRRAHGLPRDERGDSGFGGSMQEVWGWRPKVEEYHRQTKQVTGIQGCQRRRERIVRNHIGCALLMWDRRLGRPTRWVARSIKSNLVY